MAQPDPMLAVVHLPRKDTVPDVPVYANAVYTILNDIDITILFLVSPPRPGSEVIVPSRGEGLPPTVEAPVVAAVTLPHARALALANWLQGQLGQRDE